MTTVTRDFDAMLAARAGVRPTFRVGGQVFTVKARLPSKKFRNLLASFADEDVDEDQATVDFFTLCLVKSDRERFFALLDAEGEDADDDDQDDGVIDMEQLNAITEWLMELYTGKARPSSTSSSGGSDSTGTSPKVVSLSSRQQASA